MGETCDDYVRDPKTEEIEVVEKAYFEIDDGQIVDYVELQEQGYSLEGAMESVVSEEVYFIFFREQIAYIFKRINSGYQSNNYLKSVLEMTSTDSVGQ